MKRWKKILILLALGVFAAAQVFGLFLLVRTVPAETLTLSETALTLKMDEGRRVVHTIGPERASTRLLKYKVTAPDGIVAWVDEKNEMIVALAPGACQVKATLDGLEAVVDVTVLPETVIAGEWIAENGTALSIANDLSGTLDGEKIQWTRDAFTDGEIGNAYRYTKLVAANGAVLYYDRLTDTLRLDRDGAVVTLTRR
ncbi:MAG: hypothetical protein IKP38_04100 [Clostridia bacterium]|nr:hypothetical protein [Clostridia bacterium]